MPLRNAALAALTFLATLTPATPACACSCAPPNPENIALAVHGMVTHIETREISPHTRSAVATIQVREIVRGPVRPWTVRVSYLVGDGANCGVNFSVGQVGFFTAIERDGVYWTSTCSSVPEAAFRIN